MAREINEPAPRLDSASLDSRKLSPEACAHREISLSLSLGRETASETRESSGARSHLTADYQGANVASAAFFRSVPFCSASLRSFSRRASWPPGERARPSAADTYPASREARSLRVTTASRTSRRSCRDSRASLTFVRHDEQRIEDDPGLDCKVLGH